MHRQLPRRNSRLAAIALAVTIAAAALLAAPSASASSDRSPSRPKPTLVLVHGAWADGSSWNRVTARLVDAGYDVRVPPNNLRGVASDAADLAAYLSTITGPIVLAGHSYGGMVITNAARGNSQVQALVYVDALIPAEGDSLVSMTHPPSLFAQDPANVLDFVPYPGAPAGAVDTYVKASIYGEAFADRSFSRRDVATLAATQRPLSTQVFNEPSGPPAWTSIRSWAVVGTRDRIIPIGDQISMAQRAGSEIVKVNAAHLAMVTDDKAVAAVIVKAATKS